MIDADLARSASKLLFSAIAEIMEDGHALAVIMEKGAPASPSRVGRAIGLGEDITILAQAIGILLRRSVAGDDV